MSRKKISYNAENYNYRISNSKILSLSMVAAEAERAHIIKALKATMGNKTKAAEILDISRKTLWEKVKVYNIESEIK